MLDPAIPYDPDQIGAESKGLTESAKKERRGKYPERFWLQGLKVGTIDILVKTLILSEKGSSDNNNFHIKSFGEFERLCLLSIKTIAVDVLHLLRLIIKETRHLPNI